MGDIIQVPFEKLYVGEQGLVQSKLDRILHATKSGVILPPPPVKKVGEQYIFLDGRHRIFAEYWKGAQELTAYVANDLTDAMPTTIVKPEHITNIYETNKMIKFRWHSVEQIAKNTRFTYPKYAQNQLLSMPWLTNRTFAEYSDDISIYSSYPVRSYRC